MLELRFLNEKKTTENKSKIERGEERKKINVFNYILSMWIMCLEASLDKTNGNGHQYSKAISYKQTSSLHFIGSSHGVPMIWSEPLNNTEQLFNRSGIIIIIMLN